MSNNEKDQKKTPAQTGLTCLTWMLIPAGVYVLFSYGDDHLENAGAIIAAVFLLGLAFIAGVVWRALRG